MKHTRFAIVLLIIVVSFIGILSAKPETLVRSEIPDEYKWDLTDIYADWDAWEADFTQLKETMDEYAAFKGRLAEGSDVLLKAFELGDKLGMLADGVYSYVSMSRDTDTRDNEISGKLQRVQILFSQFGTATAWFDPEMLNIPWETMETWLAAEKGLSIYKHGIEDLYRQQAHVLDEQGEQLLSYFSGFSRTPRSIHSELSTSDIVFPEIILSTGDTITVTPGQYGQVLSTNRNQEDRKAVFLARNGIYNETINTYAATYNGICQRDWAFAQARKYNSTLEANLESDNVPIDVYTNLVKMVREGTDPLKRYHRARKAALELEEYHLYDTSIPILDFDKSYEYDDVKEIVINSVAPLGKDYQSKLR
ncbi:MAG: oligoendopeptidase F, partial [Candidatus Marinimicrobia bacterium]|nr:oligoendopeptidase F [Candidatus Neomarinimicrobiota bacterium]NQU27020.1 oligoendopeptidase F [Candidatus Neomarinimicrobiota bacterium]